MLTSDFSSTVMWSSQMVICLIQRRTSDSSNSVRCFGGNLTAAKGKCCTGIEAGRSVGPCACPGYAVVSGASNCILGAAGCKAIGYRCLDVGAIVRYSSTAVASLRVVRAKGRYTVGDDSN